MLIEFRYIAGSTRIQDRSPTRVRPRGADGMVDVDFVHPSQQSEDGHRRLRSVDSICAKRSG